MASLKTHKTQAKHNEILSKQLLCTKFSDWSTTCAFYAALHYVEAAFTTIPEILHTEECYNKKKGFMISQDIRKSLHAFRDALIGQIYPKIRSKYHHLRTTSETARYLLTTNDKTAFDYFQKSLVERLIQDLKDIRKELSVKLS
jgi:hypothetical protein